MGSLMPEVTRLRYRLGAGIDPSLCWNALVDAGGSELIDRTVHMFSNPIGYGGNPAKVGEASSRYSSKIAFLRATRAMVSSTFRYLTLPLHVAMVGLLEFIVVIMGLFATTIGGSTQEAAQSSDLPGSLNTDQLFAFGQIDMNLVESLVTMVVLVLTLTNSYAPKAAEGGHNLKIVHNLSINMTLTGAMMLGIPILATAIFSSITVQ